MRITKVTGFQQFTSSSLASVSAATSSALLDIQTGQQANAAIFSVLSTTGGVRFRDDGTAPSASVGMRIPSGLAPYFYQGDLQKLKFIAETGNPELNVTYVNVSD